MRKAVSTVLALFVGLGLVPVEGFGALVGVAAHQCAHGHGAGCSCARSCARPAKPAHSVPEAEGPACHRKQKPPAASTCSASCSSQPDDTAAPGPPKSLEPGLAAAIDPPGVSRALLGQLLPAPPEFSLEPSYPPPRA